VWNENRRDAKDKLKNDLEKEAKVYIGTRQNLVLFGYVARMRHLRLMTRTISLHAGSGSADRYIDAQLLAITPQGLDT